jgi:hypothetical protein
LAKAICTGDVTAVERRINAGVDVNANLDGCTLLQGAVSGANANARDKRGATPLDYAVGRDAPDVARALLAGGADPTLENAERLPVHGAVSVATYELLRDALWSRQPRAEVSLPTLMLMNLLAQHEPRARACYERALPRPSETEFSFSLTIEADGHVSGAEPSSFGGDLVEPTSVKCILDSLRALRFPKASVSRRFEHTFQLREQAGPSDPNG